VELLVVIGIIALLIAILLPSLSKARETANRVRCAANLKQVGTALILYSNDNGGAFPRTYYDGTGTNIDCSCATGQAANDPFNPPPGAFTNGNNITSEFFMMLRAGSLTAAVLICPSYSNVPDQYNASGNGTPGNVLYQCNFSNTNTLSYSIQNAYATPASGFAWSSVMDADVAIAADMNPGITSNTDPTQVDTNSIASTVLQGNSLNHKQVGQNVLYSDGHVSWCQTCMVGHNSDNIYGPCGAGTGTPVVYPLRAVSPLGASPTWRDDSVLLPSSPGSTDTSSQYKGS
jgi:prepilin-type processing-associated H-X9-DG protein